MVGIRRFIVHLGLFLPILIELIIQTPKAYALDKSIIGEQNGSISIEWEDSANSYQVQVRQDGQIFIDTVQSSNRLSFSLAPGDYQYKISVLSPFGKTVSETEWLALTVQSGQVPFFRMRSPLTVWEGDTGVRLTVESTKLRDRTTFYLKNEDVSIPVEWMEEDGLYAVTIPDGSVGSGNWDLEAVSPSGQSFTYPEALIVRAAPTLTVNKLDTNIVPSNRFAPVGIEGVNLNQDMLLVFQGPDGVIPVAALEIDKTEFAVAYLDLEGAALGTYDLIVQHPGGEDVRKPRVLTVIEPDEDPNLLEPSEVSMHIGMSPMWLASARLINPLPAYVVFDVAGLVSSGFKKRILQDLGVEARVNLGFSSPGNLYQQKTIDSPNGPGRGVLTTLDAPIEFIGIVDLSVYYRPFVTGKVAPVVQMGFGNLFSSYLNSIYIRQIYTPIPPDTVTRSFKQYFIQNLSFMLMGVGVDIVDNHGVTRLGANYRVGNFIGSSFVDDPIHVLSLTARRGFRFR